MYAVLGVCLTPLVWIIIYNNTLLTWIYLALGNKKKANQRYTLDLPPVPDQENAYFKKPVFVFDLHGVVFTLNIRRLLRIALHNFGTELLFLVFNPFFWHNVIKLASSCSVLEEFFDKLAHHHPRLKKYRHCALSMANAQDPIWKTVGVIKKLRQSGYTCALFSNIGKDTLEQLTQIYPDILQLFEQKIIAQPCDGWIQKPMLQSFQKLITNLNTCPQAIIFIDNKRKNCIAAAKKRIQAIHFTAYSSLHEQLYDALRSSARAGAAHIPLNANGKQTNS